MKNRTNLSFQSLPKTQGFSLIELMIVIAIVGIIASIAYPSYSDYVLDTRRDTALACTSELSQWMERYYTTNMTYEDAVLPSKQCTTDLSDYYTFSFDGDPDGTSYKIIATAIGIQATRDTNCVSITLDAQGTRSPALCWGK